MVLVDSVHSLRRVRPTGDQHQMPVSSIGSCLTTSIVKFPGTKFSKNTLYVNASSIYTVLRWVQSRLYTGCINHALIIISVQDNRAPWFWPVWYCEQGDLAVSSRCHGSGCEDTEVQCLTGRQTQVPAGGSHYGAVQTSKCCDAPRSCHSWRTSMLSVWLVNLQLEGTHTLMCCYIYI